MSEINMGGQRIRGNRGGYLRYLSTEFINSETEVSNGASVNTGSRVNTTYVVAKTAVGTPTTKPRTRSLSASRSDSPAKKRNRAVWRTNGMEITSVPIFHFLIAWSERWRFVAIFV